MVCDKWENEAEQGQLHFAGETGECSPVSGNDVLILNFLFRLDKVCKQLHTKIEVAHHQGDIIPDIDN